MYAGLGTRLPAPHCPRLQHILGSNGPHSLSSLRTHQHAPLGNLHARPPIVGTSVRSDSFA